MAKARHRVLVILLAALISIFLSHFSVAYDMDTAIGSANDEWIYYGFSPRVNYTPPTVEGQLQIGNDATWLTVVGYNDSTHVTVYDITGGGSNVLGSSSVDRMKAYTMQLPMDGTFSIETFFKVVSDRPIAVLMAGGFSLLQGAIVFYPSTDGGFAGKEFIFVTRGRDRPLTRMGWDYAAFAIEDSVVELRDKDDRVIRTLTVAANSSKRLELFYNKVYRIRSTGRVMISSWTTSSFTACPTAMGGYSGRLSFSNPDIRTDLGSAILLIVAQESPAEVRVYDVSTGSLVVERVLQSREVWFIDRNVADLHGLRLMVQSDEEVIVYAGSTFVPEGILDSPGQIANGITFMTIMADHPTTIFSVSDAYVFSPNGNAELRIDGLTITVPRDSYKNIPAGQITVTSNETVIVESISDVNYYERQATFFQPAGLRCFATYLLPANRLEFTYPPPMPSEEGTISRASGDNITLVAVAAFAVITVTIGFVFLRRRKF